MNRPRLNTFTDRALLAAVLAALAGILFHIPALIGPMLVAATAALGAKVALDLPKGTR